jgi:hypothetical protein
MPCIHLAWELPSKTCGEKVDGRIEVMEDKQEDASSYWLTLSKWEDTEDFKRKY